MIGRFLDWFYDSPLPFALCAAIWVLLGVAVINYG